jgi:hypothetical protein
MKNCKTCGCELNKETRKTYMGIKYLSCKKCISKKSSKYYKRRKKALEDSKWF